MPVGTDLILVLVVILIIVLLVRGPKNLPKLGKSARPVDLRLPSCGEGRRRSVEGDGHRARAATAATVAASVSPPATPAATWSNPSRPSLRPHRKRRLLQIRRRARSTAGRRPDARSASLP